MQKGSLPGRKFPQRKSFGQNSWLCRFQSTKNMYIKLILPNRDLKRSSAFTHNWHSLFYRSNASLKHLITEHSVRCAPIFHYYAKYDSIPSS